VTRTWETGDLPILEAIAPGLAEQEAMTKALASYRRQVRDDGVIGSELVVALLLALMPTPYKSATFWSF